MDNKGGASGGTGLSKTPLGELDERRFAQFLEERQDLKPAGLEVPDGGRDNESGLNWQGSGDVRDGRVGDDLPGGERGRAEEKGSEGGGYEAVGGENKMLGAREAETEMSSAGAEGQQGVDDFLLAGITVPENAEVLPSAYLKGVEKIVIDNRENPAQMVEELDRARWDLFWKAYRRRRGDGLGGGAN